MLEESIKNRSAPENSFAPKFADKYLISKVKFNGSCLK